MYVRERNSLRKQNFYTREITVFKISEYIEMFYNPKRGHSYLVTYHLMNLKEGIILRFQKVRFLLN